MSQQQTKLRVEFRQDNCSLSPERLELLAGDELKLLPQMAQDMKFDSLHVDIHKHPHKHDYHIKMNLQAGSRSMFTGERHADMMPAYRACVSQMVAKLREAKQKQRTRSSHDRDRDYEPALSED